MAEDQLARAIYSDARRKIIHLLSAQGSLNVQDIAKRLNLSNSSTSKHLKKLYDFGILKYKRVVREKRYSIRVDRIKDLDHVFKDVAQKMRWKTIPESNFNITEDKVIINIKGHICGKPAELVSSDLFKEIVKHSIENLRNRESYLLEMFETDTVKDKHVDLLVEVFKHLILLPIEKVTRIVPDSECFLHHKQTLFNYIEFLYDYWRSYDRFIISMGSSDNRIDKRPYRTFNDTIEKLTDLVRGTYRDVQENIIDAHPNVYRQVRAGAGFAANAIPMEIPLPLKYSEKVSNVGIMRQILLNPPIVLAPPMNKRTGVFQKIDKNPVDLVSINSNEWLCYPAKVGDLTILVYVHKMFYELAFSMANLFEIATDEDLQETPDGVYFYGVQGGALDGLAKYPTVFHDDEESGILVGAIPGRPEYGYFGYLKKMILTLHNSIKMKDLKLPYHGSLTRIKMEGGIDMSVLIIGDSGAGKSETLEAFRKLGANKISDIIIIADDMGSIDISEDGEVLGFGTEIGAFLRLDDLSPSSTFGAIDRAIFMNVSQVNSRVVIPITALHHINQGTKIDLVLYANNYQQIDEEHSIIEKFETTEEALQVFREGKAMAKGTTTSTGLQQTYFVNPFGVPAYKDLHDKLAVKFFDHMMESGVFMGQIRTRLGIKGMEKSGPMKAAEKLLELMRHLNNNKKK